MRKPERRKVAARMLAEQLVDLVNWTREEERAEAVGEFASRIEDVLGEAEGCRKYDLKQLIEQPCLN